MADRLLLIVIFFAVAVWGQAAQVNSSETDKLIGTLQDQVKKSPEDFAAYNSLGAAFQQKARETGDVQYYDLAEKNIDKALKLAPRDFRRADPLVNLALVYMGEHRFDDTVDVTQKAIALGSGNLAAFAIEGDALTDMGEYDDAAEAYHTAERLGKTSSSPLKLAYMLDSRLAYLRFLHGESAEAIELMNHAISAALQLSVPSENLAWLYFELGERYFQGGDLKNADLAYSLGIKANPNHYRSLAGLAKVRAAQGRLDDSIDLYKRSIAIIPFPVYVAELGEVYAKAGRPKDAQQQYDLVEFIGHLSKLNQVLANRELAVFYADRGIKLPEALELARKELDVRHDVYTWDALAWVLYKNGQLQEAAAAADKALQLHTVDPLMLFHAGMIDHSLGKESQAEALLKRAVGTNPHFHVVYGDTAARAIESIARSRAQ